MRAVPLSASEPVQRAAAFIAARSRGDLDAAEAVLAGFATDRERVLGFALLSELTLRLLAERTAKASMISPAPSLSRLRRQHRSSGELSAP